LLLLVGLLMQEPLWLQALRNAVFDQYQRWEPRRYEEAAVRIVDIDEESLARIGQWPWPRTAMADLVHAAAAGGAAALGFDIVFAEPDRSSPREVARHWELTAEQRAAFLAMKDHDTLFAQAMDEGKVVLGFAIRQAQAQSGDAAVPPVSAGLVELGAGAAPHLRPFAAAVAAVPMLAEHAFGHGALAFLPDSDGVVRRVPLLLRVADRTVPSLVAELLRASLGERNLLVRSTEDGIQEVRIGDFAIPTTRSGEMWLHYAPASAHRAIPAWKLLAGQVAATELQGKILLVGSSAQGLLDLRFGTQGHLVPGVEVHAQALEQILGGHFLQRPAWARMAESLVLLAGAALACAVALSLRPAFAAAVSAAALIAVAGASWWLFSRQQMLFDPLTPGIGIACAFLFPSVQRHHTSDKRRRWVSQAFSRYVSPNLVSHIVQNPEQLVLGGKRQTCSFIFTDLAGFTALMEAIDPAEAVLLLNRYLDGMIEIAFRHQGTLDRIVGDSIAIMFSAPIAQADHQERAVACALELQRFATAFAHAQHSSGVRFGHTRIGVHAGEVIVGNFGGETIFDYRALGDPVNTASRLESANALLGTRMCISEAVLGREPATPAVRRVGQLVFKGKTKPLLVFQPAKDGLDLPVDLQAIADYERAYALMADRDPQALAAFERLAQTQGDEPLVRFHLERLRKGERGDIVTFTAK
jgi:adenylate cyclase